MTRRVEAVHEAGHAVGGKVVGARKVVVVPKFFGGWDVKAKRLPNARAALIFLLAGEYAAGTSEGCGSALFGDGDRAAFESTLREYSAGERSAVRREVQRETRRLVRANAAWIERVADCLLEHGKLKSGVL